MFWKKVIENLDQDKSDFKNALELICKYNGLNKAKKYAENYAFQANQILNNFPKNKFNQSLSNICEFVFSRKS